MSFSYRCRVCAGLFTAAKRGRKTCSHACSNRSRRKYDLHQLTSLAIRGERAGRIGAAIGIHPTNIGVVLKRHGLYRLWQRNRYAKLRKVAA